MKRLAYGLLSLFFIHTCLKSQQISMQFDGEIKKEVSSRYLIYFPNEYDREEDKKWPLILFLHGSGERGQDLDLVKMHGPPKLISDGREFPFVVLSPQCPAQEDWSNDVLISLLDEVVAKNRIDPDRIYLTGLSMGGWGVWNLAIEHARRFAAIAPVCGRVDRNNPSKAGRLAGVPIWVFHGALDPVVPVTESGRMVLELRKQGVEVQFTVYPEAGHDSWTETYKNAALYDWFLKHKRSHDPSNAGR